MKEQIDRLKRCAPIVQYSGCHSYLLQWSPYCSGYSGQADGSAEQEVHES